MLFNLTSDCPPLLLYAFKGFCFLHSAQQDWLTYEAR